MKNVVRGFSLAIAAGITLVAFQNCGQNFETLQNKALSSEGEKVSLGPSPIEYVAASGEVGYRIPEKQTASLRRRGLPESTVPDRPRVFLPLGDLKVSEGANLAIPAMITGEKLTYVWYKSNVVIANQTSNIMKIQGAKKSDAGNYKVVASNQSGSVTNDFTLAVTAPKPQAPREPVPSDMPDMSKPSFSNLAPTQEINEAVNKGGQKTYIVWKQSHTGSWSSNGSTVSVYAAVGGSQLGMRYQWYLSSGTGNLRPIENATSADISFTMHQGSAVGNFILEACNDFGCARAPAISVRKVGF
jgi:Immunoglobulin I-set domain